MNDLTQYGLSGAVIAGLCWYVLYLTKEHRAERKEWKATTEKQFEDSNRIINENTGILSELSTIIKSMKR